HQLVQIDAGFDTHALQHVGDVFAGHIACRTLRIRTATGAGNGAVHHAHAFFEAHKNVRERLVVGVVEVHRQRLHRYFVRYRVQHCTGLHRRADADGVAQRYFVAAKVIQPLRYAYHIADGNVALVWATEHRGNIATHAYSFRACTLQHRTKALDGFIDRGVDVLLVERFAGRGEHRDAGNARRTGAVVAKHVGHQRGIVDAGLATDAGVDFFGIGELRHPLRADETGRFDGFQPAGGKPVDQFDLGRGGDDRLLVLQAVAGADFDDADMVGKHA